MRPRTTRRCLGKACRRELTPNEPGPVCPACAERERQAAAAVWADIEARARAKHPERYTPEFREGRYRERIRRTNTWSSDGERSEASA